MIYGIGTDITDVRRFNTWVYDKRLIERYFNNEEMFAGNDEVQADAACRHYAVRFAAKEAFSKAMGTGLRGFNLRDVWIVNDDAGKPFFRFGEKVRQLLGSKIAHVSLSHESDYAIAFVVIEAAALDTEVEHVPC